MKDVSKRRQLNRILFITPSKIAFPNLWVSIKVFFDRIPYVAAPCGLLILVCHRGRVLLSHYCSFIRLAQTVWALEEILSSVISILSLPNKVKCFLWKNEGGSKGVERIQCINAVNLPGGSKGIVEQQRA